MIKPYTHLPTFVGRRPCGCVAVASVIGVPTVTLGLTWERLPEGEEPKFTRCSHCTPPGSQPAGAQAPTELNTFPRGDA